MVCGEYADPQNKNNHRYGPLEVHHTPMAYALEKSGEPVEVVASTCKVAHQLCHRHHHTDLRMYERFILHLST